MDVGSAEFPVETEDEDDRLVDSASVACCDSIPISKVLLGKG